HPGSRTVARSAELEIHCQHIRREIVRPSCSASGHVDGSVDRARLCLLRATGIFARALFGGAGRQFLPDIRTTTPKQTFSIRFVARSWRTRLYLQRDLETRDGHCRHPGDAPARAVHRPGCRSDVVAPPLGSGEIAIQNVALPVACRADDIRVGLALLADRYCKKMGIG